MVTPQKKKPRTWLCGVVGKRDARRVINANAVAFKRAAGFDGVARGARRV